MTVLHVSLVNNSEAVTKEILLTAGSFYQNPKRKRTETEFGQNDLLSELRLKTTVQPDGLFRRELLSKGAQIITLLL
jgi:hypothetical protein